MLGAGGFHHDSGYVPGLFIDKIYLGLGNLAVLHAERYCHVDKLLQVIDSHLTVCVIALCRKMPSAVQLSKAVTPTNRAA